MGGNTHNSRFAWARLNADTLFVALLVLASGLFSIGERDDLAAQAGAEASVPLFWILIGSYVVSGAVLLYALMRSSVSWEVIARSVLIGGTALNVYRHLHWSGMTTEETIGQVVVLAIVSLTSWLRLSVLLGKDELVITRSAATEGDEK